MKLWNVRVLIISALLLASSGGYADWKHTRIEVNETAGLARDVQPIQAGVAVPREVSADSTILVEIGKDGTLREVKFQLMKEIDSAGYDERWKSRLEGIKMFEIAFLTELPANASLEFRLYYDRPETNIAPAEERFSALTIEQGEGLSRNVNAGEARFEFHPESGQMIRYEVPGTGYAPDFIRQRVEAIHGSADLRTSRNNLRAWNIEDDSHGIEYAESAGPVTWQTVRRGYMPHSDRQIKVSVSYAIFAGVPYVLTSSHISFDSDRIVNGVRNNQLVFSRGLHTHGVYMGENGDFVAARAFEQGSPDEHFGYLGIDLLPPDIPFIGMFHEDHGYGIGVVTLNRSNLRTMRVATPQSGGAHYHFLDSKLHGIGSPRNFFYLVRYESCHVDSNKSISGKQVIPAGSVYSSESAILAYPVGGKEEDDRFIAVKSWAGILRNPPNVHISMQGEP